MYVCVCVIVWRMPVDEKNQKGRRGYQIAWSYSCRQL